MGLTDRWGRTKRFNIYKVHLLMTIQFYISSVVTVLWVVYLSQLPGFLILSLCLGGITATFLDSYLIESMFEGARYLTQRSFLKNPFFWCLAVLNTTLPCFFGHIIAVDHMNGKVMDIELVYRTDPGRKDLSKRQNMIGYIHMMLIVIGLAVGCLVAMSILVKDPTIGMVLVYAPLALPLSHFMDIHALLALHGPLGVVLAVGTSTVTSILVIGRTEQMVRERKAIELKDILDEPLFLGVLVAAAMFPVLFLPAAAGLLIYNNRALEGAFTGPVERSLLGLTPSASAAP